MTVENPMAYSFIMQDDIYLLNTDKLQYGEPAATAVAEPEPAYAPAPPAPSAPLAAPEPVHFKHLGGNKKGLLVITYYPEHDFMHDKHLAALESTLTRLGFTRDDFAIVNRAGHLDAEFKALSDFFNPKKLLILGKSSMPAGMEPVELNKLKQLSGLAALFTFSFDDMMDSMENKKAFWEQMKQF